MVEKERGDSEIFKADAHGIQHKTLCSHGPPIKIYYVGTYRPYSKWKQRSDERGLNTQMILALQEYKPPGIPSAVEHFFGELDKFLAHTFPIVLIPSHDPEYDHQSASSGLFQLVQRLTTNKRINAASCLVRHTKVKESSSWGDRTVEKHLNSIKVMHQPLIENRSVLLVDDIATTGNSMRACKKLLMDHGASGVVCLTLGLTERKP